MGKGSRNKKKIIENIMYFNDGVGPSSSVGTPLTQEEAERRALAYNISMRYEMLEEADKVRLDGKIKQQEERAMVKVKGHMLKEKKDPGAFIFLIRLESLINENALADTGSDTNTMPYIIYEQLGRDDITQEERNIIMINYTEAEVHGWLPIGWVTRILDIIRGNIDIPNRILTTFDGLTRQTFKAARSKKIIIAESDSDDEEDYVIKRNDMGTPIHNSRPIGYQNNTNPAENMTLSTLDSTSGTYDHEARSSRTRRSRHVETVEEELLPDVHHEFLEWSGYGREAKSCYNSRLTILLSKLIYSSQTMDWQLLHKIGCGEEIDNMLKISLKEAESGEEIFFFVAWVRAFNIREPTYPELYREFYATYEFDEVCADDELQSKKIISFRLGGRAHSLTLLEFARRLGLYHAEELEEKGFDTYFQGGLRSDENFNAREYWERISTDRDLHLSGSSITLFRFLILRVLHKMITYGLCQRTTGYEKIQRNDLWLLTRSQKDSQICCGQFISKIARKSRVLTQVIVRTLSTPVYCRDLDRTTLRELIDSEDRMILDISVDDVPRVAAQRALRVQQASM
ncbi:hypothetical protein Tco_0702296 [Tanacetum coccineum]|uniref:Uncharacterized protein n=1 Tax=Tanacetum coccineum TaxID=301880 RepID=A0ABQ4XWL6_9ASTR